MYSINDIKVGMIFRYPDLKSDITSQVIEININGRQGNTKLKIIESNSTFQWFCVGKEYSEMSFIDHWNKGTYILRSEPEIIIKSRLELIDI